MNDYFKEYYIKNKKRILLINEIWRKNNKEKVCRNRKLYRCSLNGKEIHRKASAKYRSKNIEYCRKKVKEWAIKNRERINYKQRLRRSTSTGLALFKKARKRYTDKYPEKIKAGNTLRYHVYYGNIIKPKICSVCFNKGRIEAHHEDYSKPLDVIWVCKPCHNNITCRLRQ